MKISLIVAMARNGVIGLDGQMPWHLSADLKHFKKITLGSPIIMGRKTFESIGRPLPGRSNIIISRNPDYQQDGCTVFDSIDAALKHCCTTVSRVFIIGGSTLYQTTLAYADTLYVTDIQQDFLGDSFFPVLDKEQWLETAREDVNDDPDVSFSYSFITYQRK
ncbi:dihydrofolate reductase [Crenothrix polyspora]|uniref:Dihydrofolate reductase n=1 Tax=Crenothrix polyspora TaxID=360316 RepID=A0A1R4H7T8_9GAMM|nr:dihydrofolate reductase [Crenothrix polyspora]SJM92246.1 Dihydrofolate reductase type 3 [Crenothrix polyspora]